MIPLRFDHFAAAPVFLVALSKLLVTTINNENEPSAADDVYQDPNRREAMRGGSALLSSPLGRQGRKRTMIAIIYIFSAVSFFLSGQRTAIVTVVCWSPLTTLLSQWTRFVAVLPFSLLSPNNQHPWIQGLVHGGPLGHGCGKALEVLAAALLWKLVRGNLPEAIETTFAVLLPVPFRTTPAQSAPQELTNNDWMPLILGILLLALAVNGVLAAWSHWVNKNSRRRGVEHEGVQQMVAPTLGRKLSFREHAHLAALAAANAVCEECTARGFWRHEFESTVVHPTWNSSTNGSSSSSSSSGKLSWQSNVAQALVFGAWHYHGIPSGWTGVALTTVYGGIMGYLADLRPSAGLWLPILAHSIVDYYIFAVVARHEKGKSD